MRGRGLVEIVNVNTTLLPRNGVVSKCFVLSQCRSSRMLLLYGMVRAVIKAYFEGNIAVGRTKSVVVSEMPIS
jgi:hypothetical protein